MEYKNVVRMASIEGQRCGVNGGQEQQFKIDFVLPYFIPGILQIMKKTSCNSRLLELPRPRVFINYIIIAIIIWQYWSHVKESRI